MSHYRNLGGGKRDSNEPEIMRRFRLRGWHPEQISGNRLWDLIVFAPPMVADGARRICFFVDVKMPDGKVTPAQEGKWRALAAKDIPVYVVRTAEDVDALMGGELAAWEPSTKGMAPPRKGALRTKPCGCLRALGRCEHSGPYAPPRSKSVDAAKEAEETFAPLASLQCCDTLRVTAGAQHHWSCQNFTEAP